MGSSLHRITPLERTQFEQEYGAVSPTELDLELMWTHLSRIRVVADLNRHAEDCIVNYWASEDGEIFLVDARRYVMDALRITPREHPERGRAYKILAYLLFARNKPKEAILHIEKAPRYFPIEHVVRANRGVVGNRVFSIRARMQMGTGEHCSGTSENGSVMKLDPEWMRWGRGQVNSGLDRGYLYQNRQKSKLWKWKGIEFEAPTPKVAIEMLMSQQVGLKHGERKIY